MDDNNYEEYFRRIRAAESGGNKYAKNPFKGQTASGIYQFTKGTFEGLGYDWKDRFDNNIQTQAAVKFTKQNEDYLKKRLGIKPNYADLYGAHFLGAAGYAKLYRTSNNLPISSVMSQNEIDVNPSYTKNKDGSLKTVGEVKAILAKKTGVASTAQPEEEQETSTYKPYVSYLQENAGTIETAGKYSEPKEVTEAKKEIYQAQQEENFLEALSNLQQQPQQEVPQQEQSYLENPELFQLAQVPQIQYEQFQKGGTWENQMLKVAREKAQKNLLKDKPSIQDLINDTKNRGKAQQLISKDNTNVKVNNRAENFSKVSRNKTDREIAEERRYKIDSSIKARESSYTKDNWRQKLAEETQATGDKFRVNLQPNFFDDYLNPAVMIGSMASNLGQAPLQAQQSDSILPYITSIGTPLAVGAMAGLGTQNTGQFVNNLANPLAGTGDLINNLGNKYLPNTYKLNPKAFKLNEENLYRQIGEQGYQDAVQTKVIRSADNKSYPNPYFAEAKDFDKLGSTGSGATGTRPDFIAEMPMVKEGELLAYPDGKGFWVAGSPQIPLEDVNLYKKDWLQGYKKMEQGGEIELQDNERAFLEEYFQDGGIIKDNNGYWNPNNWGKTVEISSPSITMKGVKQPLVGYAPETGETKIMLPGEDYFFNGANRVIESQLIK